MYDDPIQVFVICFFVIVLFYCLNYMYHHPIKMRKSNISQNSIKSVFLSKWRYRYRNRWTKRIEKTHFGTCATADGQANNTDSEENLETWKGWRCHSSKFDWFEKNSWWLSEIIRLVINFSCSKTQSVVRICGEHWFNCRFFWTDFINDLLFENIYSLFLRIYSSNCISLYIQSWIHYRNWQSIDWFVSRIWQIGPYFRRMNLICLRICPRICWYLLGSLHHRALHNL